MSGPIWRFLAYGLFAALLAGSLTSTAQAEPSWTTYHRDAQRSGDDPDATQPIEPALAWQTVDLRAPIWSQPLVLGDRVYVATVGDEVYALEAATGKVVWEKSVGTPVPSEGESNLLPCGDVTPTVGVVGTPVIDPSTQTIYLVADTSDGEGNVHHLLKGLSLASGEETLSTNVDPPGADPKALLQRTALNLDAGKVIFGYGGNDGDCGAYKGTVVAVPEDGGAPSFWQYAPAPPSSSGGAVWATGGPAIDTAGNVYASTGNPNPPAGEEATEFDYSDSVVKLNPSLDFAANPISEPTPPLAGFEPPTWQQESNTDTDLGSAAPELLPGGLLFQAGKGGTGYLIDETTMSSVFSAPACSENPGFSGSFGGDSFADGVIYIPCENGTQALSYDEQAQTFTPLWQADARDAVGPPIVSAGLVWTVATGAFKGGGTTLYGLSQATGKPSYTVTMPSPVIDHFASPSAAGGRLFVASGTCVTAYQVAQLPGGESGSVGPGGGCQPAGEPPGESKSESPSSTGTGTNDKPTPSGQQQPPPLAESLEPVAITLRSTHLVASAKGLVRVALHCAAPSCGGTIALRAKLLLRSGKGSHRVRRTRTVVLTHKAFEHAYGSFEETLRLDKRALSNLRRHKGRLALVVEISAPGHAARRFTAVLT
jgi:polyvinyl alcohol dehydrogenase (cytochrome)